MGKGAGLSGQGGRGEWTRGQGFVGKGAGVSGKGGRGEWERGQG